MIGKSTASTAVYHVLVIALLVIPTLPTFAQLNENCTVSVTRFAYLGKQSPSGKGAGLALRVAV